jgi:hypothetical protein
MRRVLRALGIVLLAVALVANIAPAFAMALPSAPAAHVHAAQDADHHHGSVHADHTGQGGSVHGDHADCPGHANDDACNKCCGVCITAGMMPVVTAPGVSLVTARGSFSARTNRLTAHGPPSDPGIPKPLT